MIAKSKKQINEKKGEDSYSEKKGSSSYLKKDLIDYRDKETIHSYYQSESSIKKDSSFKDEKIKKEGDYINVFKGPKYSFSIYWPSEDEFDLYNESADVLVNKENKEYSANFMTLNFIEKLFLKNEKTGENAKGVYLSIPRTIITRDFNKETIRKTIDDLIEKDFFDIYFK